ncbi:MAG: putative PEP-binding protein, partial [bacterium]
LPQYIDQEILPHDPFQSLDIEGIGQLVAMAVDRGREEKPELKIGVCGEHGGDPKSVTFFHEVGLDYVSCSPYRVPIARLAAAQAVLEHVETSERERPTREQKAEKSGTRRTRSKGKGKRRSGKPPKKV